MINTGVTNRSLLAGLAAAAMLTGCLAPPDECAEGQSLCDGNYVRACIHYCTDITCWNRWDGGLCRQGTTCVAPPGLQAMCVESPEPDPACGSSPTSTYCSGDAVASCTGGYRNWTAACGTTDDLYSVLVPGDAGTTHCIEPQPGATTCVPPGAVADPACASGSGPHCHGDLLVECTAGLAVSRTACGRCEVHQRAVGEVEHDCLGYLGDGCQGDPDCAAGLSCRPDSRGSLRCTTTCDDVMSTPEQAIPIPSRSCMALFQAGGPPPTGSLAGFLPGNVLACVNGSCEWLRR